MQLGFLVLSAAARRGPGEVVAEAVALVREKIGPVAAFRSAAVVARLTKTRSRKIIRATMRKIADGQPYKIPATIDDPDSLSEIESALRGIAYTKPQYVDEREPCS